MTAAAPQRVTAVSAVALALGLALAGCAGSGETTPSKPAASSFVGETLQYALEHTPGSVASTDASKALGLRPATPDPEASEAVVIAACYYNDTQVNVVVIPSVNLTAKITADSRRGVYSSLLTDCQK